MRTLRAAAALACVWALSGPASAQTIYLDAVLAAVDTTIITAGDLGLARGLGLFGFHPSETAILPADVERFVGGRLVEREADRLTMQASADQLEEAWRAAVARVGGEAALMRWLDRIGIDVAWARRMVEADLRRRRFIDLRFRSFAFVSEAEVTGAMGTGPHTPETRRRVRETLQDEAVQRSLAGWIQEARSRTVIRYVDMGPEGIPVPFPMPPEASRRSWLPLGFVAR